MYRQPCLKAGEGMRGKVLCLPIVIAILLIIFFSISGIVNAAVAPVSTPLGYNTLSGGLPARIATDNSGKFYVTDNRNNLVRVYSNNGVPLKTIGVYKPVGIAVDSSGRIYVGSSSSGSVSVLSSSGELLYKLGSGDREFGLASDITISSSGTVYVTDSIRNLVKAYTLSGTPVFSFGGFSFPTGIAIDDAAGEIYVADHVSSMIKIFNLSGVLKRYIRGAGMWRSTFIRPQGVALDSTRIYIADAYNSTVVVYGKDGIFLKYMGRYGREVGEFRTPLDVAIDRDNKVFVSNYNNNRVEVIGIDSYTLLNVSPDTLSLSVFENGSPVTQDVNLTSTGNVAEWVASVSDSWVSVSPSAGITPSDVSITVNPSGLGAGNYTAYVRFNTPKGTESVLQVNLEVKSNLKTLYVAPTNMAFKYQQESPSLPSGDIVIASEGGSLSWVASASVPWISLSSTSGITPSSIKLSINNAVNALQPGTYDAKVIIDSGSARGSPAAVNVSLRVIYAGTVRVTTNLDEAGYDITPVQVGTTYSGTGREWSYDEVAPGDYRISFHHVSKYIKPQVMTFTVKTGREVVIEGIYRIKPVATHILAGAGGAKGKDVAVLPFDNTQQPLTFEPFKTPPISVRLTAGDLDGSGVDKIVVTDYKKTIKVYTSKGVELASLTMPDWNENPVIAVRDIDNDGVAEIIVGAKNNYYPDRIQREIKLFSYNAEKKTIEERCKLFTEDNADRFTIAIGDINGDGIVELIMADKERVRAYSINLLADEGRKLSELWTVSKNYIEVPEIATGDINDDGVYEIALSTESIEKVGKGQAKKKGIIKILKATGEDYEIEIDAFFSDLGYEKTSRITMGDIDGDGIDEVIAGAGDDVKNRALIRTFESDGTFTGTTIKAMDSMFGVNVSSGRFE